MRARWTIGGTTTAVVLLATAAPAPDDAVAAVLTPVSAADVTAPVVALASLVAWALAGWLALVVVTALLARAPGAAGAVGVALAARVAPLAVRRAVEVALGLTVSAGVLAGPAAAATADSGGPAPTATSTPTSTSAVSLDWPGAGTDPELDWPAPAPPTAPSAPPSAPSAPVRAAALPAAGAQSAAPGASAVVVAPGDSLWVLAERHLTSTTGAPPAPARTAAAWPAWWAANRDVVGADPDVIHPGAVLRPPADR